MAQPSLPDWETMQLLHDIGATQVTTRWSKLYKARRGRGLITQLHKFHRACAVSKSTRRYRRSKSVKVAAAKRATQARALRSHKQSSHADLNESKNAEQSGKQEAQKQASVQSSIEYQ
jgi:hypothetical protein